MADLDETAGFTLQIDPGESVRWLVPKLDEDLGFHSWLDTRMIAFPGEPKRRCDTVAELLSRSGRQPPWALILEVESRARPSMPARLLEYLARALRKLRHGPRRRDAYQVAAVLIYLTGRKKNLRLRMRLPGTKMGMGWNVRVMSLARQSAARTLARIAQGTLGRSILPWVPLMFGGGEPETVQEWVRLAREETNLERRKNYGALALVFAEWVGCQPVWQKALEGWEMWQSQVIAGWKKEGEVLRQRGNLLKVLRTRFPGELPADLAQTIQGTTDLDVLSRWFDAALTEPSLEAFQNAVRSAPPPGNGAAAP